MIDKQNFNLKVDSLTKLFGKKKALDNVSFTINKGELVGVIGRNGAGKTTLFKTICGLYKPTSGSLQFNNPTNRFDFISYLPEERGLIQKREIKSHVTDMLCYKGLRRTDAERMVDYYLERFELTRYKDMRVDTLSKGNQQRLQFIAAVANRPDILILDEPFSGLDILAADRLWDVLYELRDQGTTILFSTHGFDAALHCCSRFIFIKQGQIIEDGSLEEISSHHAMILEIDKDSFDRLEVKKYLDNRVFKIEGSRVAIDIASEHAAEQLFLQMGSPFFSHFTVRRMTIEEIFRYHHQEEDSSVNTLSC